MSSCPRRHALYLHCSNHSDERLVNVYFVVKMPIPVEYTSAHTDRLVAEFFAGIGLMRMGLEQAGWTVAFANDIDPSKQEMYDAHFNDSPSHFHLGDVHKLDPDSIPNIALATASFPCTDLSLAGGRKGLAGAHSSAFWGFIEALDGMKGRRPPIVLLENVTGFLTSNGGKDFEEAMVALNGLGYQVDPFIIDAASFVPQSRKRLFVVGVKQHLAPTSFVADHFLGSTHRPDALASFIFTHPHIKWALRDLPPLPSFSSRALSEVLEDLPRTSSEWFSEERTSYLISQMSTLHSERLDQMRVSKKISYGTVFRRVRKGVTMAELRTDGIAGCLRTPKGGSARQILIKAGQGHVSSRLLTPRECARLMGADDFVLEVPLNQALFGFGDAVCVPVVKWIGENYLNLLLPSKSVDQPITSADYIKSSIQRKAVIV